MTWGSASAPSFSKHSGPKAQIPGFGAEPRAEPHLRSISFEICSAVHLRAERRVRISGMLWLGRSTTFNRSVHLIEAEDIPSVSIPGRGCQDCFVCFIALGDARVATARVYDFADRLLHSGCAYICIWGPDCERWHDITDERNAFLHASGSSPKTVMTTWHSGESIADALFYFFTCTVPDNDFPAWSLP